MPVLPRFILPPVRGSRRTNATISSETLESLRGDAFERNYALRWLTSVVEYASAQEAESEADAATSETWSAILATASSILAVCAGTSAAGVLSRTFTFPSPASPSAISVTLQDVPLDNDLSSVGAQTWGGACVLSELIAEDPDAFMPSKTPGLRILELGAGTGLVSIAIAKILNLDTRRNIKLTATDFYPAVLANLRHNIAANDVSVETRFLDWESFMPNNKADRDEDWREERFDVIVGADLVYEPMHARWLHACVRALLRADERAVFHLIVPHRETHTLESRSVEGCFPRISPLPAQPMAPYPGESAAPSPLTSPPPVDIELGVLDVQEIICEAGEGNEEVAYGLYRIGWGIRFEP
ncbi:hypothetical protein HWV62_41036 [Athelia sp. TMB]|nr:hypothetical protein HWV62_41036 [Athelia sp. TMB]